MINYDALSENVKYIFTGDAMHGKYAAKTYFWTVNVNLP